MAFQAPAVNDPDAKTGTTGKNMALPGTVQSATPGMLGFDTDREITSKAAQQFAARGFHFCLRYLAHAPPPPQSPNDLSIAEAIVILDAGLALMPVQHVRRSGWQPNSKLGEDDGQFAAQKASQIGFPPGVNVWCDLEGVKRGTNTDDVIAYCNAWHAVVKKGGYLPGLYVGFNAILNEKQLANLKFQSYWRSQSNVPNVGSRGYQLIQSFPSVTRNGIEIDIDVTQSDYKNGHVQWLIRAAKRRLAPQQRRGPK